MTTTLSSKGQVVIPAALRRKLALQPGDALEITLESMQGDPHIVIKRHASKRRKMKIITDPVTGWPVLKGPPGTPKLTTQRVKEMLADFP